jgi:hypothetical protein
MPSVHDSFGVQLETTIWQKLLQVSEPPLRPKSAQVFPPKSSPSQASPSSMIPLPHVVGPLEVDEAVALTLLEVEPAPALPAPPAPPVDDALVCASAPPSPPAPPAPPVPPVPPVALLSAQPVSARRSADAQTPRRVLAEPTRAPQVRIDSTTMCAPVG